MDTIPQDTPIRQCTKCKMLLPHTHEYFHKDPGGPGGFHSSCRECVTATRHKNHPLKTKLVVPGKRQCTQCQQWFPATREYFHALKSRSDGLHSHCKGCRNRYHSQFRQVKPDVYSKEYEQARRKRYGEKRLQQKREYYQSHKDDIIHYQKVFRDQHRERYNIYTRNREALKRNANGTHTEQDILTQYQRQKGTCYYCKEKLGKKRASYHVDHVVPLSRGGTNDPSNLVIACPSCNTSKRAKLPHEWHQGGHLM